MFDPSAAELKIQALENQTMAPDLWDDPQKAQQILQEKNHIEKYLTEYQNFCQEYSDLLDLSDLAAEEKDHTILQDIEAQFAKLHKKLSKKSTETLLSGPADKNNAFLEIHAGAGGTEAQDWANILLRMYIRWAERKKYKIEYVDETKGEEAGVKSVTIKLTGQNVYGWLKYESGVHRLVRISPFDSGARRHTSFASVWVYPEIDETINIEIEEKDLKIDTFRASGAGGQHVNTTDSAVRITHIPTNIIVQCQQDRSQHRNRATALNMLKARLYELELQKKESEAQIENASKSDIGWGHQIRSYVLHPYQMIKDVRTQTETSQTQSFLDGEIDTFLEAILSLKAKK